MPGKFIQERFQNSGSCVPVRDGFVCQSNSVQDDVFGESEQVFRDNIVTTVNDGSCTGCFDKADAGTRTAPEFN